MATERDDRPDWMVNLDPHWVAFSRAVASAKTEHVEGMASAERACEQRISYAQTFPAVSFATMDYLNAARSALDAFQEAVNAAEDTYLKAWVKFAPGTPGAPPPTPEGWEVLKDLVKEQLKDIYETISQEGKSAKQ